MAPHRVTARRLVTETGPCTTALNQPHCTLSASEALMLLDYDPAVLA